MLSRIRAIDAPARAVLAMAAALLAAWALARLGVTAYAPEALAQWIMARTPADLANALLDRLGDLARPAALLGGFATYLGLAALAGMLPVALAPILPPHRGRSAALAMTAAVVAVLWGSGVALMHQPAGANAVLALLFAAAVAALAWRVPAVERDGRRRFLTGLAVSGAGVLVAANVAFLDALRRAAGAGGMGAWLFRWEPPAPRAAGFDVAGLAPELTPVERFYRMSKNVVDPNPAAGTWRLRVGGRRWRIEELLALPRADVICTLRCISNRVDGELMSTATFSGVRVRDLLAASGVPATGAEVVFIGLDGHADSISLAAALDDGTIVAYAMNGRALTRAHGHPARLLIPGRYGFKNVKWLAEVRVSAAPFTGHWQELGWTRDAAIKTMSRIDVARVEGEGTIVAGVAFAGTRGISAVRVRLDDGPWREARLHAPALGPSTWVQWRLDAPARVRAAVAQAFDGTGTPQPADQRGQFPDGAQGLHRVQIPGA